jgi:hypothetical protein
VIGKVAFFQKNITSLLQSLLSAIFIDFLWKLKWLYPWKPMFHENVSVIWVKIDTLVFFCRQFVSWCRKTKNLLIARTVGNFF